jgi:hypothetical protein
MYIVRITSHSGWIYYYNGDVEEFSNTITGKLEDEKMFDDYDKAAFIVMKFQQLQVYRKAEVG